MNSQALDESIISFWKTPDGRWVRLRPIVPGDVARMAAFFDGLSCAARYFRFGSCGFRFSAAQLAEICQPDPTHCRRFIVVSDERQGEVQIACGRFWIEADGNCELAIVVADAWQGAGVASLLLRALIQKARALGLKRMYARVLASNTRMLDLARRNGFAVTADSDYSAIKTLILSFDSTTECSAAYPSIAIDRAQRVTSWGVPS